MKTLGTTIVALGLGLSASCSSGGGGGSAPSGSSGSMFIESCSLGCTTSANQVSCGVTDVFVNQEIRIRFSRNVDLASVNNNSFQVVQNGTGVVPPGTFSIDPQNARTLIYRPRLTFDSSGNPVFGLQEGATYTVRLPGTALNDQGPFVRSTGGQSNQTRLLCVLSASQGVFDVNPGPPVATVTVDVQLYDMNGDPTVILPDQPAQGASDVARFSPIRFLFNDIMNPATLVNPVTGESAFIRVLVDPDGNTADPTDQVAVQGDFTINIDQTALRTTVVFTPSQAYPSAGPDPDNLRKIVVELPSAISDLGGNGLLNAGDVIFIPEVVIFPPTDVVELFEDTAREDGPRTGNPWAVNGRLGKGPGGGTGRLGDLFVPTGESVVLNTDVEDFSSIADAEIFDPANIIGSTVHGQPDPVMGGLFEFASLRIEPGGQLRFEGSNAVRLLVRGESVVQGILDLTGETAPANDDLALDGGVGGAAGPGGGAGGDGGVLPDGKYPGGGDFTVGLMGNGVDNPNDPGPLDFFDPADYVPFNATDGMGIPFPDTLNPTDVVGEGTGGIAWPQPTAMFPDFHFPMSPADATNAPYVPGQACKTTLVGGAGGGGAHALSGLNGIGRNVVTFPPTPDPPISPGGDAADLAIDATVKSLSPSLGLLRGGAGGGGSGSHLVDTTVNGSIFFPADCTVAPIPPLQITVYSQHSGAGGGGGGGGVQIASGRRCVIEGVVDSSGGDGAGLTPGGKVQGAGAGAGGAVLLQSPLVLIQSVPARIDVAGGRGGSGPSGSRGGDGGAGFFRLETFPPLPNILDEATKLSPTMSQLTMVGAQLSDIFTIAEWTAPTFGAGAFSGAQSCWIQPPGNFFVLFFQEDDVDDLGWDMRIKIQGIAEPQSFRGANDLFPVPLELLLGNQIGASPVVVRFQGARALGPIPLPCEVDLAGADSDIFPGSLSGWVDHPSELNTFFMGDPALRPNMIRFAVIWDSSKLGYDLIEGIEDLTFAVQPD
jgi:hypothetical protein